MRKMLSFLLLVALSGFVEIGAATPRQIRVKGNYVHTQTKFVFPEDFAAYSRQGVYAFDKQKENIGVVYGDKLKRTTISLYVYPAGNGDEDRLGNEYLAALQDVMYVKIRSTGKEISLMQEAVRHEGKKYICNGFKAVLRGDEKYNGLTVYECGRWFFKMRITSDELDSAQVALLEHEIYTQFPPSELRASNPFASKSHVHVAPKVAISKDSMLFRTVVGSTLKKVEWAMENVREEERASGFPGMYLELHIEALKSCLREWNTHTYQYIEDGTKRFLSELQMISDAGFLEEFVMEQFQGVLIMSENKPSEVDYEAYEKWKSMHKITINLRNPLYSYVEYVE